MNDLSSFKNKKFGGIKMKTKNIKLYNLHSYITENGVSVWCRNTDRSCIGRRYNFNKELKSGIVIYTSDFSKDHTFGAKGGWKE